MIYYILTSSLNIDNITTAECISPAAFYPLRGFGYDSIDMIDPLAPKGSILVFTEPIHGKIKDGQVENYPMLIEYSGELRNAFPLGKESSKGYPIFSAESTIYLDPSNTKFIFFSEQAKLLSEMKCRNSKCNKNWQSFQRIVIPPSEIRTLGDALSGMTLPDVTIEQDRVEEDKHINSAKGFILAFRAGKANSISREIGYLRSIQKKIYNIVSAIINSGTASPGYISQLRELEDEYNRVDPHVAIAERLWNEQVLDRFETDGDRQVFIDFLSKYATSAKECFLEKNSIRHRRKLGNSAYVNWKEYQDSLEEYTVSLIKKEKENQALGSLAEDLVVEGDMVLKMPMKEQDKLYNEILRKFFYSYAINETNLRTNRVDLAQSLRNTVRDYLREANRWDNSAEKDYLNAMLLNIAEGKPFSLMGIDNEVLQSMAAFVMKGEDFDSLWKFCVENGLYDFSYVLGFWGVMNGYAAIPQSFGKRTFEAISDELRVFYSPAEIQKQRDRASVIDDLPYVYCEPETARPQEFHVEYAEATGHEVVCGRDSDLSLENERRLDGLVEVMKDKYKGSDKTKDEFIDYYAKQIRCFLKTSPSLEELAIFVKEEINTEKRKTDWNKVKSSVVMLLCPFEKKSLKGRNKTVDTNTQNHSIDLFNPIVSDEPLHKVSSPLKRLLDDDFAFEWIRDIVPSSEKDDMKDQLDWIIKVHRQGSYTKGAKQIRFNPSDNVNSSVISHLYNNVKKKIDMGSIKISINTLMSVCDRLNERYPDE